MKILQAAPKPIRRRSRPKVTGADYPIEVWINGQESPVSVGRHQTLVLEPGVEEFTVKVVGEQREASNPLAHASDEEIDRIVQMHDLMISAGPESEQSFLSFLSESDRDLYDAIKQGVLSDTGEGNEINPEHVSASGSGSDPLEKPEGSPDRGQREGEPSIHERIDADVGSENPDPTDEEIGERAVRTVRSGPSSSGGQGLTGTQDE